MKKNTWIVFVFIVVLILLFVAIMFLPHHYERTALISKVTFGMSPAEIRSIYGEPESKEKSSVSPTLYYSYYGEYENNPAEIHFRFIRILLHYELYEVTINCRVKPDAGGKAISEKMLEQIKNEFSSTEGYYEENKDNYYKLGIQYGAVGVSCVIEEKPSYVQASLSRIY